MVITDLHELNHLMMFKKRLVGAKIRVAYECTLTIDLTFNGVVPSHLFCGLHTVLGDFPFKIALKKYYSVDIIDGTCLILKGAVDNRIIMQLSLNDMEQILELQIAPNWFCTCSAGNWGWETKHNTLDELLEHYYLERMVGSEVCDLIKANFK